MNKRKPIYWGLLFILLFFSSCLPVDKKNQEIERVEIGFFDPLVIDLADIPIQAEQEFSLSVTPDGQYSFHIADDQIIIHFLSPLIPGQNYQVEIAADGIQTTVPFMIRFPDLIFISNANINPQIWKYSLSDNQLSQMTDVREKILELSSAFRKRMIFFLSENERGEREIWRLQPDEQERELFFQCDGKHCFDISCSPNAAWVAFSEVKDNPQLVVLDSFGDIAYQLPYDASDTHFSPNGQYIYFLDKTKSEMVVFSLLSGDFQSYPSARNLIGSMDEYSEKILYGSLDYWGGFPVTAVNELSVKSQEYRQLFVGMDDQMEYFNPTHFPGSDLITVSVRDKGAGNSTQLWLVDGNGNLIQKITQDYQFSHAAFQWSPDGQYLAYQRLRIGSSNSRPQVAVWHKERNAVMIVSEDAIQPHWLP